MIAGRLSTLEVVSKTTGEAGHEGRGWLGEDLRDRESLGRLSRVVTQSPLYLSKGQKGYTRKDAMEVALLGVQSLSPFSTAQSFLKYTKNNPRS